MDLSVRYRPAGSRVIHEAFDNEVVIVNLDTGRYYCVQNEGADVWQLMMQGLNVREIAAALALRYSSPEAAIAEATDALCRELCAEDLLTHAEGDAAPPEPGPVGTPLGGTSPVGTAPGGIARPERHAEPRAFHPPHVQIYTDMQDLLLLDPIHEVDAGGWPIARTDGSGGAR